MAAWPRRGLPTGHGGDSVFDRTSATGDLGGVSAGVVHRRRTAARQPDGDRGASRMLDRGQHRRVTGHPAKRSRPYGGIQTRRLDPDGTEYVETIPALLTLSDSRGGDRPAEHDQDAAPSSPEPAPHAQGTGRSTGPHFSGDEVRRDQGDPRLRPGAAPRDPRTTSLHTRRSRLVDRGRAVAGRPGSESLARVADRRRQSTPLRPWERMRTRPSPRRSTTCCRSSAPTQKGVATRKASGAVINAVVGVMPETVGLRRPRGVEQHHDRGRSSCIRRTARPTSGPVTVRQPGAALRDPAEHGMGAILSGIHAPQRDRSSGFRPPGFLPAGAAGSPGWGLPGHHDLGPTTDRTRVRDGPTHQPIGTCCAARDPGLDVATRRTPTRRRAAWRHILQNTDRPAGSRLTRQNVLPVFPRGSTAATSSNVAWQGLRPARRRGGRARRDPSLGTWFRRW